LTSTSTTDRICRATKGLEIAMKKLTLFFGVIAILLGGLWLLQGLGAV
jgi:hypothetical protein